MKVFSFFSSSWLTRHKQGRQDLALPWDPVGLEGPDPPSGNGYRIGGGPGREKPARFVEFSWLFPFFLFVGNCSRPKPKVIDSVAQYFVSCSRAKMCNISTSEMKVLRKSHPIPSEFSRTHVIFSDARSGPSRSKEEGLLLLRISHLIASI